MLSNNLILKSKIRLFFIKKRMINIRLVYILAIYVKLIPDSKSEFYYVFPSYPSIFVISFILT